MCWGEKGRGGEGGKGRGREGEEDKKMGGGEEKRACVSGGEGEREEDGMGWDGMKRMGVVAVGRSDGSDDAGEGARKRLVNLLSWDRERIGFVGIDGERS